MRTVTTTREYDNEGRMVRETVVETERPDQMMVVNACACGYSTFCPVHGYRQYTYPTWPGHTITVTSGTAPGTTVNSGIAISKSALTSGDYSIAIGSANR